MRYNAEQIEAHTHNFRDIVDPTSQYVLQILDRLTIRDITVAISYIDPVTGETKTATNICSIVNRPKDGKEHLVFSKLSKKLILGFISLANTLQVFLED